ncbi:galactose-responsive transcription factor GAL4 [Sugiyamaella lignohabitans]|uniref:Galactose-responsive transcription factor GAL4 n=1 Tax=Sugiyamaella lignohabitans TaxID=796027 RepID=A0A170QXJ1_9ASCO|nr:galactose-responsive transcription factor GAL4 [Sugiyamaella lignohabitans]ANB15944.1 galactose-responsive transcription factor GAL4 [Sugiyamaella lignohabitans]
MSSDEEMEIPHGAEDVGGSREDVSHSKGNENNGGASSMAKRHVACSLCRKRKLKCDGKRPKCSTCAKQNHICEYTETFRKAGPRRGYVKTLEQRVSQLEQMLAEATTRTSVAPVKAESAMLDNDDDNNPDSTYNIGAGDVSVGSAGHGVGGAITSGLGIPVDPTESILNGNEKGSTNPVIFNGTQGDNINGIVGSLDLDCRNDFLNGPYDMQISSLNMDEALPPDEMIKELLEMYFNGLNRMIPLIDRTRFMTRMSLVPSQRPKLFLQYAIFLKAACTSDKYTSLTPLFYKRACKYMNKAETSSRFRDVASVEYVQASVLISTFEYRNALFPQAWLRVGSTMRACQMLNMHVVDVDTFDTNSDEVTMSDSAVIDEIRRTYWVAVLCDRTASAGTGWPCISNTDDIFTKIPLDDSAIDTGGKSRLVSFESIFRNPDILARYKGSRLIIYILYSECQYEIAKLIMFPRKENDLSATGSWMAQYTRIDNLLSSLIFVLDPVPASDESPDRNLIINVHLMVHTAILCLNKCALLGLQNSPDLVRLFRREELLQRCANAATEITLLIRMSRDISSISAHPILTFVIYTCARFFLTAVQSGAAEFKRFKVHLDFLITTLRIMRVTMPMAQMFCDSIVTAAGEMFKNKPAPDVNSKLPPNCLWPEPDIRPDTMRREEELDTPQSMSSTGTSNGMSIALGAPGEYSGGFFHHSETKHRYGNRNKTDSNSANSVSSQPYSIPSVNSTRSPEDINTSSSSISDEFGHLHSQNTAPTSNDSGDSSSYLPSGLTPLTGTPDASGLAGLASIPVTTPSGNGFPVGLDWSSLMTTEAMWNDILSSTNK